MYLQFVLCFHNLQDIHYTYTGYTYTYTGYTYTYTGYKYTYTGYTYTGYTIHIQGVPKKNDI